MSTNGWWVGGFYVILTLFQSYRYLKTGDNQSPTHGLEPGFLVLHALKDCTPPPPPPPRSHKQTGGLSRNNLTMCPGNTYVACDLLQQACKWTDDGQSNVCVSLCCTYTPKRVQVGNLKCAKNSNGGLEYCLETKCRGERFDTILISFFCLSVHLSVRHKTLTCAIYIFGGTMLWPLT